MSPLSESSAHSTVCELIDSIGASRVLRLLELAQFLRVELVARRGAQLQVESLDFAETGYDARMTWDGNLPQQDQQLAFGLARYVRMLGADESPLDLAIALLRLCELQDCNLL
jgi:hypothetical protein